MIREQVSCGKSDGSGAGRTASLTTASALDTDLRMDVSVDKFPTGSGAMAMMTAIARSVGNADYRLRLRVAASGSSLQLLRVQNFAATTIATASTAVPVKLNRGLPSLAPV